MNAPASKKTASSIVRSPRDASPRGQPAGRKFRVRMVQIPTGQLFKVPQGIQRIDSHSTHGWQVRYDGTKMFSDGGADGSGAKASYERAVKELISRMLTSTTPALARERTNVNKSSNLPVGISGPIVRGRAGRGSRSATLSVLLPRYGEKPEVRSIYIGSEGTYTLDRFKDALATAIELRTAALAEYEAAATKARRRAARELKALLGA